MPPPGSLASSTTFTGTLDAVITIPNECLLLVFDLELTGMFSGETIFDSKIFDLGAVAVHRSGKKLSISGRFPHSTLV